VILYYSGVSGSNDPRRWIKEARVMRAFNRSFLKLEEFDSSIFLDSGSFSLRKYFVDPSYCHSEAFFSYIEAYATFVKSRRVVLYANVDVIGDAELTWRNHMHLESRFGLAPIPVVHLGTSFDWIDRYLDHGCKYIGLGGLVLNRRGRMATREEKMFRYSWLDHCFYKISKYEGVKVHGFGLGTAPVINRYPWHSVDSTTWIIMSAMGQILVPPRSGGMFSLDKAAFQVVVGGRSNMHVPLSSIRDNGMKVICDWLKEIGLELGEEGGETGVRNSTDDRVKANTLYLWRMVEACNGGLKRKSFNMGFGLR